MLPSGPATGEKVFWLEQLEVGQHGISSSPPYLFQATRIAVACQAVAMVVCIGLSLPSYLDYLFHPMICSPDQWCLDFRGLAFGLWSVFLGPPALVLVVTTWLWRRQRVWPAVLPLLVDLGVLGFLAYGLLMAVLGRPTSSIDALPFVVNAMRVLLILIPACVSATLVLVLLRSRKAASG